jgi:hypothetical protein
MIIQFTDVFQLIADIIAIIVSFLQPIVMPIGAWMVDWITFLLQFFPKNSWTLYIIIFILLIISGGILNIIYPGDKPLKKEEGDILPKVKEELPLEENRTTDVDTIDEFFQSEEGEKDEEKGLVKEGEKLKDENMNLIEGDKTEEEKEEDKEILK